MDKRKFSTLIFKLVFELAEDNNRNDNENK